MRFIVSIYKMNRFSLLFILVMVLVMTRGCKCQLAKEPSLVPYQAFDESKENNAFLLEYFPEKPYLEIEGKKFDIKKAWIENAHLRKTFRDEIASNVRCFVMTLNYNPKQNMELKEYINELGNGSTRVWFFLEYKFKSDTIKLNYRHSLNQPEKSDIFLLFKKL